MRGRSGTATRPAPIFIWPTSELPIWPLGRPTKGLRRVDQALRAGRDQPVVVGRARIEDGVVTRVGPMAQPSRMHRTADADGSRRHQDARCDRGPRCCRSTELNLLGQDRSRGSVLGFWSGTSMAQNTNSPARLAVDRDVVGIGARRIAGMMHHERCSTPSCTVSNMRVVARVLSALTSVSGPAITCSRLRGRQHLLSATRRGWAAEIHSASRSRRG